MQIRKNQFIIFFLLIVNLLISASDINFKNYRFIDGLSSNNLTDITIDDKNRTWIGTYNGITMFNGNEFNSFYTHDSLSEKYINCLSQHDGSAWFGTKNALLHTVEDDGKLGVEKFIDYPDGINDIAFIGTRAYAVSKNKLLSINTKTGEITEKEFRSLKLIVPMGKNLIAATKSKLFTYNPATGNKEQFANIKSNINTILSDNSSLYIGSEDGLYVYEIVSSEIELAYKQLNKNIESIGKSKHDIWFTAEYALYKLIDGKPTNQKTYFEKVKAMAFTHEDIMLAATFGDGLYQFDAYGFKNVTEFGNRKKLHIRKSIQFNGDLLSATKMGLYSKRKNKFLLNKDIFDVAVEKNNLLWIATDRGLYTYNNSTVEKVVLEGIKQDISIISLHLDKMGRKWLGTMKGLIKYDSRPGKKEVFLYNTADGLVSNYIFDICAVPGGIVTASANGLNYFKKFNRWTTYPYSSDDFNSCVYDEQKEALWVSTTRSGIRLIDIDSGETIETITIEDGLSNNEILSLTMDNKSNLWVATDGGGASVHNGAVWVNIDSRDGLINNSVNEVYQLDSSTFIISTQKGYSVYTQRKTNNNMNINQVIGAQKNKNNYTVQENQNIYIDLSPTDYLTHPKKYQFRYKDDDIWRTISGSSTINYFTSNSGKKDIEIQFIDRDLNYSKELQLNLNVLKPWYLRANIAIPLYGGTLILLVTTIFSLSQYLKKRRESESLKEADIKRQYEEMEEARKFQMDMLPHENPEVLNLDIATHINTAEKVGGDYYDFFIQKNSNSLIVAIGDATGHGMVAGNIVSITKAGLSSVNFDSPINEILEKMNRIIKKVGIGRNRMCLNICHIKNDQFEVCSAGMPPTYLYKKNTNTIDELMISGLPAGSLMNNKYSSEKFDFELGDVLVMITDGLPECEDTKGEFLGYETIKNTILFSAKNDSNTIKDNLTQLGNDWMEGNPITDDITFMVIKKC